MSERFECVVAGHICLDIIPAQCSREFVFTPGRVVQVGPALLTTGGAVSNTGLSIHRLGIKTRLMGKVGPDLFGQTILQQVNTSDKSLSEDMIQTPTEASSYSIILSSAGMDRVILHYPGCNDGFVADDIDYGAVASTRLFHFGYPPLMKKIIDRGAAELIEIFKRAKATGVTTSLDMCLPDPGAFSGSLDWKSILLNTLPHVDVFVPSLEEMIFMLHREKFDCLTDVSGRALSLVTTDLVSSLGRELLAMGPKIIGLKIGHLGFYLRTGKAATLLNMGRSAPMDLACWSQREIWSACFEAEVVGTTGAGDATVAGFLAALLRGLSPDDAVTMACAVGGCSVEAADALGGVRTWDETLTRVAQGWRRQSIPLNFEGWLHSDPKGSWYGPSDSVSSRRHN
jgi:sugar/nucleoside kinase (ribokinase family)